MVVVFGMGFGSNVPAIEDSDASVFTDSVGPFYDSGVSSYEFGGKFSVSDFEYNLVVGDRSQRLIPLEHLSVHDLSVSVDDSFASGRSVVATCFELDLPLGRGCTFRCKAFMAVVGRHRFVVW